MSGIAFIVSAKEHGHEGRWLRIQSALERRQEILEKLMHRRHDTMSNLAHEFHVNERTIRRDICILSREYPLCTTTGPTGGVSVLDGYYTRACRLTTEQIQFLERVSADLPLADQERMREILLMLRSA